MDLLVEFLSIREPGRKMKRRTRHALHLITPVELKRVLMQRKVDTPTCHKKTMVIAGVLRSQDGR